jgi:dienelactone hydrolase
MRALKTSAAVILLAYCALAQATYKQREERWAAQIQEYLVIGEMQWLSDSTGKFLSIYTKPNNSKAKGAVILMHGEGRHPDWPEVISLLRRSLAEQGYATLSLQMPILPRGAPLSGYGRALDEAAPRIREGMKFLRAEGYADIALIGHGMGAAMGLGALAEGKIKGVRGFIGVGMAAHVSEKPRYPLDPRLHAPTMLAKLRLPLLDIYGGLDDKVVAASAPERAEAARRAGNRGYEQYKIADADHGFGRFERELSEYIAAWLAKLMTGRNQR